MPESRRATINSEAAFQRAKQLMPGGVSSPVRAFKGVGGHPVFIREGSGRPGSVESAAYARRSAVRRSDRQRRNRRVILPVNA